MDARTGIGNGCPMASIELLALAAALALTLVHIGAGKLRFLEGIPRSRWLSLAGAVVPATTPGGDR
jgi:hypothetical protein